MRHLEGAESSSLVTERCISCEHAIRLSSDEINELKKSIEGGWTVVDEHHLKRVFKFRTFLEALEFTNRVGEIAEEEGHHPVITVGWGKAEVMIYTHALNGLSRSDFILAAKISSIVLQTYERNYEATD